jgi:hypothetical protein
VNAYTTNGLYPYKQFVFRTKIRISSDFVLPTIAIVAAIATIIAKAAAIIIAIAATIEHGTKS